MCWYVIFIHKLCKHVVSLLVTVCIYVLLLNIGATVMFGA